jgi:ADP-heptose:LPS heptosyltransferase
MTPHIEVASSAPTPGLPPVLSVLASPMLWRAHGLSAKIRWQLNARLGRRLWLLNAARMRITVVDAFGSPGDTLLTAAICRHLRQWYPRLQINCLTPNPALLAHDPNIDTLNQPETFFSVWSWYPDLIARRDVRTNVLKETFARLGLEHRAYQYRARVYLTKEERAGGLTVLGNPSKPVLTFHTRSREEVKDWPLARWVELLTQLKGRFHLVQLGDDREPRLQDVHRLVGLSLRESLAVLAHAHIHVGADSFWMHAANGLDVPSVIIFGGSRPSGVLGYESNINLFTPMPCGPCWIQSSRGERCTYGIACMDAITADNVVSAVGRLEHDSIGNPEGSVMTTPVKHL